jgi:hypothetical protein
MDIFFQHTRALPGLMVKLSIPCTRWDCKDLLRRPQQKPIERSKSTNHSIEMCRLLCLLQTRRETTTTPLLREGFERKITPLLYTHTHHILRCLLLSLENIAAPRLFVALDGEIQNICDACLLNLQCCCNRSSNRICSDCIITSSTRESGTTVRLPRERELLGIFDMVPPQLLAAIGQAFQTRDRRIAQGMCVLHPRLAPAVRAAGLKREGSNQSNPMIKEMDIIKAKFWERRGEGLQAAAAVVAACSLPWLLVVAFELP